ncbi:MAG TPA: hypothetical protein VG248_17395 [Caulobacteraceae bacterium]|jgi:hypothetical protein|nr:hypothetical protein [Caulobacteraceae bacterium]
MGILFPAIPPDESPEMLADDELDLAIDASARVVDQFVTRLETLLAESDRRRSRVQVALTAVAFAYLADRQLLRGAELAR